MCIYINEKREPIVCIKDYHHDKDHNLSKELINVINVSMQHRRYFQGQRDLIIYKI